MKLKSTMKAVFAAAAILAGGVACKSSSTASWRIANRLSDEAPAEFAQRNCKIEKETTVLTLFKHAKVCFDLSCSNQPAEGCISESYDLTGQKTDRKVTIEMK